MDQTDCGDVFDRSSPAFHFHGSLANSFGSNGQRDLYGPPQRGIYPLSIRHQGDTGTFGLMDRVLCSEGVTGRAIGGVVGQGSGVRHVPDANEGCIMKGESFQWTNCLHVTTEEAKPCTVFLTRTHLSVLYQASASPCPPKSRKTVNNNSTQLYKSKGITSSGRESSRTLQPIASNFTRSLTPRDKQQHNQKPRRLQTPKSVDKAHRDVMRQLQCLDSATKAEALERLREAGGILNSSISSSISYQEDDDSAGTGDSSSLILRDVKALEQQLSNTDFDHCSGTVGACGEASSAFYSSEELAFIQKIKRQAQQYLEELPADEDNISDTEKSSDLDEENAFVEPENDFSDAREISWSLASLTEAYPRHYKFCATGVEIFGPSDTFSDKEHTRQKPSNARDRWSHIKTNYVDMLRAKRDLATGIIISPLSETSIYIVFSDDTTTQTQATNSDLLRRRKDFMWKLKLYSPQLNVDFFHSPYDTTTTTNTRTFTSSDPLQNLTDAWRRGCISNYDYLLRLNAIAGRSQHDITSYPVLPWVLSNYTSETLDLTDSRNFRDLSKPMGALDEDRLNTVFMKKFHSLVSMSPAVKRKSLFKNDKSEEERHTPPFMYGSHYSSVGGVVLHYLVRMKPFDRLHRQLQGGSFDVADRLFDSVPRTWEQCSRVSPTEVKELTKEWYSNPSFLCNHNNFALGRSEKGKLVSDIVLPPWANGCPVKFVNTMRDALESEICSGMLHEWIDLIFGFKQRGQEAESAFNVFYHLTYYDSNDILSISDSKRRREVESLISNLGHCPKQLFHSPHLRKLPNCSPTRQSSEPDSQSQDQALSELRGQVQDRPIRGQQQQHQHPTFGSGVIWKYRR